MPRIASASSNRFGCRLAFALAFCLSVLSLPASAVTSFFKVGDMVTVWTSDYMSEGTDFIWEARNIKYRLKMTRGEIWIPQDQVRMYRGNIPYDRWTPIRFTRFRNDPHVNASSFAIVSSRQIVPFPMPVYQNKTPQIREGEPVSAIPQEYNEIKWNDVSSPDDMEIEATWTSPEGTPKQKKLTGRDEITAFYKKVADLVRTLPASNIPSYIDTLFPGESLLLTKGNIRVMQSDVEKLIKGWMEKQKGANSPADASPTEKPATDNPASPAEEGPEAFIANGPQGEASFDFTKNGGVFTIKNGVNEFQTKWGRRSMYQVVAGAGAAGKIGGKTGPTTLPSLAVAKTGLDYSQKSRIVGNGEVVVFVNPYGKYVAVKVMKVEDAVLGGSRNRVTIRWKVLQ